MVRKPVLEDEGKKGAGKAPEDQWGLPPPGFRPPWDALPFTSVSQVNQSLPPPRDWQALKEDRNIDPKVFALMYVDENKEVQIEMSPSVLVGKDEIFTPHSSDILTRATDEHTMGRISIPIRTIRPAGMLNHDRPNGVLNAQQVSSQRVWAKRKRPSEEPRALRQQRNPLTAQLISTDEYVMVPSASKLLEKDSTDEDEETESDQFADATDVQREFRIDDDVMLENFYITRFKQIQQVPCKTILKAWVKAIEPKKQQKNPYNGGKKARKMGIKKNGGKVTKPDWWHQDCPHKEPDHLRKEARIKQLLHVLRVVTKDDSEFEDCKKVTIDMLENSINDTSSSIPGFAQKYLKEVYFIRRQEQRYQRDEIDGEYRIQVKLPDQEPKRPQKRSKPKNAAKRPRNKMLPTSNCSLVKSSPTSGQQQPTDLVASNSLAIEQYFKREPTPDTLPMDYQMGISGAAQEGGILHCPSQQTADLNIAFSALGVDKSWYHQTPSSNITQTSYDTNQVIERVDRVSFPTDASHFVKAPGFSQNGFQERSDEMQQMYMQSSIQPQNWTPHASIQMDQSQNQWSYGLTLRATQQDLTGLPSGSATENQYFIQPTSQGMRNDRLPDSGMSHQSLMNYNGISPGGTDPTGSFCNPNETDPRDSKMAFYQVLQ